MDGTLVTWWVLAAAALACAVGMVAVKNPVHSALLLVGNFVAVAVIYLLLSAPLLFAIQLIVYAGAMMVGRDRISEGTTHVPEFAPHIDRIIGRRNGANGHPIAEAEAEAEQGAEVAV